MAEHVQTHPHPQPEPPSITHAIDHLLDAAQAVVGDQVDLARLEAKETIVGSVLGATMTIAGAAALLLGWVALLMMAYVLMRVRLEPWSTLLIIGAANVAMGAVLATVGVSRLRNPSGE